MKARGNGHGGDRKGSGRKPNPEGPLVKVTHRVTQNQKDKLAQLGGAEWLRRMIDDAPL